MASWQEELAESVEVIARSVRAMAKVQYLTYVRKHVGGPMQTTLEASVRGDLGVELEGPAEPPGEINF